MSYTHHWGPPYVCMVVEEGPTAQVGGKNPGLTWTDRWAEIRQACQRCGTSRLPSDGAIVESSEHAHKCWNATLPDDATLRDWTPEVRWLQRSLGWIDEATYRSGPTKAPVDAGGRVPDVLMRAMEDPDVAPEPETAGVG